MRAALVSPPTLRFATVCLVTAWLLTGCSSGPGPGHRGGSDWAHRPPPTPLAGQAAYFQGRLLAQINVGGSPRLEAQRDNPGSAPADGEGRHRGHRGGGMSMGMGGMGGGSMEAGGREGGMGGGHYGDQESGDEDSGPRMPRPRPMLSGPLVMIHLRFTNQGPDPVEVFIRDFISPLGNFAVQPEKLTLAPGQSLETEPMSSPVAGSLAEIEAKLALQVGQQTEEQTISLQPVSAPPKTAAPTQ